MKVPVTISFDIEIIEAIKAKCYAEKIPVSEYVSGLVKKNFAEIEAAKIKNQKQTTKKGK